MKINFTYKISISYNIGLQYYHIEGAIFICEMASGVSIRKMTSKVPLSDYLST